MAVRDVVYRVYERRLRKQLNEMMAGSTGTGGATARAVMPRHVGVILDGNRRWAREAGFADINDGHRAGARKIREMLAWCDEAGIELVTLWLLSTDNLRRKPEEVQALLEIIAGVVDELADAQQRWQVRLVGAMDLLPAPVARRLKDAAARTSGRTGGCVNVAVGYGGRDEIAHAVRQLLAQHASAGTSLEELAEDLDPEHIAEHLYTSGQPDPDLLIRTSGEQRLSGFMLWQSAHSEFWFCEAYWPEFRKVDFLRALREYVTRHRRYGH